MRRAQSYQYYGYISIQLYIYNIEYLYIADGHHRYEAGLRYISNARSTREIGFNESINYRMVQLISMSEPGLITRSYHRYIKLNKSEIENYSQKISSDKNTFKYEVDLSILNYTNVEKYYKFICDY